jgi:LmbE family N-acetylglucosaminyl deacetylase
VEPDISKKILIIVGHADDEVLGCGGTIARHIAEGDIVRVLIIADGESSRCTAPEEHLVTHRRNAAIKACAVLGVHDVDQLGLPDNQLDTVPLLSIVKKIETVIDSFKPITVYTHHARDVNIDHQIVHESTIIATRPQPHCTVDNLFFFEVLSSTNYRPANSQHPFAPNFFVDVTDYTAQKFSALDAYSREMRPFPHARSHKAVEALLVSRGTMVGVEAAEAFEVGRCILRKKK